MADRNPNIPSERRMDMEDRERFNEEEANRRFAEKEAKIKRNAPFPKPPEENATEEKKSEE